MHYGFILGCVLAFYGIQPATAIDLISTDSDRLELHAQGIFASNDKVYIQGRHTGSIGHRINMIYTHQLNPQWAVGMRQEWAVRPVLL
ncbi:hypothetical protein AOC04_11240 [Pseudomonas versuta]|nr:hypothetical protein AOC04_11240 [Pseudomonas versuta]